MPSRARWWSATLPLVVLASGGLVFLSLFAWAGGRRAVNGWNDFLPFYAGGRLAFTGHLYDQPRVLAEEESASQVFGENLHFIRPPWFAALLWPLARLPYPAAYLGWEILAMASIGAFAWCWHPAGRAATAAALCFSIPALFSLMNGQDTPLLLASMTASVVLAGRGRPFAAGMMLALCQTKFHLFLPLWLILAAGRRWRLLGGMATASAALMAASCAVAGWRWPLEYITSISREVISPATGHMPTLYYALANVPFPGWWWIAPAGAVAAAAWAAGRRLSVEAGLAIAPALIMPVLKHTSICDALLLLPLLLLSVADGPPRTRLAALVLLTPVPWFACLAGAGWQTAAPLLLLLLVTFTLLPHRAPPQKAGETWAQTPHESADKHLTGGCVATD